MPEQVGPVAGDLGFLKYGVFLGDNRTFSVTLAALANDDELRSGLLAPPLFTAAAGTIAATAPWVDEVRVDPITPVHVMAAPAQPPARVPCRRSAARRRDCIAVGDAHTCTNPLYGRGCSLAMVQAGLLADAVAAHPQDPVARSVAYEEACHREIQPWYRAAVIQDRASRAGRRPPG